MLIATLFTITLATIFIIKKMNNDRHINLDHAATTPILTDVNTTVYLTANKYPANPSAEHLKGIEAMDQIDLAKDKIADLLKCDAEEIFFTSGATEAINWGLTLYPYYELLYSPTEHKAVLNSIGERSRKSLHLNEFGQVDIASLYTDLQKNTNTIVVAMHTNNETGIQNDIERIGELCSVTDSIFFCDATQAIGKYFVYPKQQHIGMMAFSAHKFGGPKGIGALYIDKKHHDYILPLIKGGGQQEGLRAGTLNTAAIAGFGKAAEFANKTIADRWALTNYLQEAFLERLLEHLPDTKIIGASFEAKSPYIVTVLIQNIESEALMAYVGDKVSFSRGSACNTHSNTHNWEPSHVLRAMRLTDDQIKGACRFSFDSGTLTPADVVYAADVVAEAVREILAADAEVKEVAKMNHKS